MSKRKIVALILFVFISLFMFSFATPRGIGIKKNNNVPEKETFTVVFKNYDGTILDEQTIEKGNSANYKGETPKRPSSKVCNYEFTGWSDSIENVTSNIDAIAQYECEKRSYVVRFMDDDKVTLLATDKVIAGGTAIYQGKTPTKINHVFNGWSDTLSNILSNKIVYAIYYADGCRSPSASTKWENCSIAVEHMQRQPSISGRQPRHLRRVRTGIMRAVLRWGCTKRSKRVIPTRLDNICDDMPN